MEMEKIKLKNILRKLYEEMQLPSPQARRQILLTEMDLLGADNINCINCEGDCCSFQNNSMQIDLIQALDIVDCLQEMLYTKNVEEALNNAISQYRLNYDIPTKHNSLLRKRYTCPFYKKQSLGCMISASYKPYGCLAFNPTEAILSSKKMDSCKSQTDLLERREALYLKIETDCNYKLKEMLNFNFSKKSIPEMVNFLLTNLA